jgi:hypothetical protein
MATPIATAFVRIRPDTTGFGKEVKQDVDKAGRSVAQSGKKHGHLYGTTFAKSTAGPFRSFAGIATKSLAGIGAGFAAIGAAKFGKDIISAASDMNESVSKATVVFGDFSDGVIELGDRAAASLGISKQAAIEASATFGNLFVAMKIGKPAAAKMSTSMVTLASDLASFNNVKPEDALEALRSGLVGETEPLRKFGVNLNDAALRQEALRLGLVKTTKEVLPPAAKAQAAYSLILQQTKTAQGDFARTSDGLANKQRILSAKWKDAQATLGKALLPAMVTIASVVADKLIPAFGKFAQKVGSELQPVIATLVPMFQSFLKVAGPILANALVTIGGIVRDELFPALQRLIQNVGPILLILFQDLGGVLKTVVLPALKILASIVADRVVPVIATLAKWIKDNREIIPALGIAIGVVLVPAFIAWAVAAGAAAVATIAAALPVIALVAVIAGAAFLIIKHWKTITKAFKAAFDWVKHNWPLLLAIITGPIGIATKLIIDNLDTIVGAFKTALKFIKDLWNTAWGAVKEVFRRVFLFVANFFFDVVAAIIHHVGTLVGVFAKLPGPLGKPFKKAKEAIKGAEDSVRDLQDRINRTHGKKVVVSVKMQMKNRLKIAAQQGVALTLTGKPIALAAGGIVRGPGGPVGDKIPAALSDGEYVIKAASARKLGTQFLDTLNNATSIGGDPAGMTLGFAAGGSVSRAQALIRAQANDPYIWGGVGPNGFDCSGLAGLPYAALTGRALYRRYFTTASDFRSLGFKPGTGAYTIGVNPYTHMAGNIGGLPFEAASTRSGIHVGRGAQSVMRFAKQYFLASLGGVFGGNGSVNLGSSDLRKLMKAISINWGVRTGVNPVSFDRGGWLRPGLTLAHNGTGRAERVGGGYHITVNVPPNANQHEIGRQIVESVKAYERGSGTGWRR